VEVGGDQIKHPHDDELGGAEHEGRRGDRRERDARAGGLRAASAVEAAQSARRAGGRVMEVMR
jgi:hypothetical protein